MAIGNITLPEDLLPKLEEAARAENRTADDLAKEAIEKFLKERSKLDLDSREWRDFIDENRRRAVAARSEAIVTGDKDLLRMGSHQGIRIQTLRDFLQPGKGSGGA